MDTQFILSILPILAKGAFMTVKLTAITIVLGTGLGLIAALAKVSRIPLFSLPAHFYTWVIRGVPLLLQLYLIYYGFPQIGLELEPFPAAVLAFSVCAGAYIAEIIRAAIESIDRGQMEAAYSLGMSYGQAMRRVILPQTYKRLLPPMANEFIALLKDSSLVSTIAMADLLRAGQLLNSATFRSLEIYVTVGIFYLLLTSVFTIGFQLLEKRVGVYEEPVGRLAGFPARSRRTAAGVLSLIARGGR